MKCGWSRVVLHCTCTMHVPVGVAPMFPTLAAYTACITLTLALTFGSSLRTVNCFCADPSSSVPDMECGLSVLRIAHLANRGVAMVSPCPWSSGPCLSFVSVAGPGHSLV